MLCIWFLAYAGLLAFGSRVGLPKTVVPALILLFVPPFLFCMRASRRVTNRTREAFPDQWASLNRDWTRLELRYYLFDERTFGDQTIACWKRELRWWLRACIVAILLFLPTLLLIEWISK